ncbi:hypothetical protein WIX39_030870 [Variovorax sp. AB1(2024)]|uniref:hypothetical protein n=1 Tax=Variovorax sp. AB1(2024) TaxID=3132214 RepID=UPI00309E61EE
MTRDVTPLASEPKSHACAGVIHRECFCAALDFVSLIAAQTTGRTHDGNDGSLTVASGAAHAVATKKGTGRRCGFAGRRLCAFDADR